MSHSATSSLQDTFAPRGTCFGCGAANPDGLQIKSFLHGDLVVCHWQPQPHHEAFSGVLNGGIVSALLDCHCNWTALGLFMRDHPDQEVPCTVTAKLNVEFLAPTLTSETIRIEGRLRNSSERKFSVEGKIINGEKTSARCEALFVAVEEGHPAFHRWG